MARQVADSIISMRSADSKDMAQRFVQEFDMEPFRGYGASVGEVFRKLKRSKCQDPYKPASEQFNGSGSYGTMSTNLPCEPAMLSRRKLSGDPPETLRGGSPGGLRIFWLKSLANPDKIFKKNFFLHFF